MCNLVNWPSSEKRRMYYTNLTMYYTINLVNFFFVCLFWLRNMATDHVHENQELVRANSTRVDNVIFSFS